MICAYPSPGVALTQERLKQALIGGELVFGRQPFSATICHFRDAYCVATAGLQRPMTLLCALLLAALAAAGWAAWAGAIWWAVLPALGAAVACFLLASMLSHALPAWRALTHTSFLAVNQHDRALAGLREADFADRPLLLYLRDFDAEEHEQFYTELEQLLVAHAGTHSAVVAIANPTQDPTLRVCKVPKLLVPNARWRELAVALIERADRICIASQGHSAGLDFEIEHILLAGKQDCTLFVDMSDSPSGAEGAAFEHRIQTADAEAGAALHLQLLMWFGIGRRVARVRGGPRPVRESHALRYVLSRAFLLGWRGFLPRSDWAYHRAWFKVQTDFGFLHEATQQARQAEIDALSRGVSSMPTRGEVHLADGRVDLRVERYNQQLRLQKRLDTAINVLGQTSAWSAIRRRLPAVV